MLDEQRRIVAEIEKQFSRLDEAVANLKRVRPSLSLSSAALLRRRVLQMGGWPTCRDSTFWARHASESSSGLSVGRQHRRQFAPSVVQRYVRVWPGTCRPSLSSRRSGLGRRHLVGKATSSCRFRQSRARRSREPHGSCYPVIFPDTMMRERPSLTLRSDALGRHVCRADSSAARSRTQSETTAGIYKIAQPQVASISLPLPPTQSRRIVAEVDRRLSIVREVEAEVDANLKRAGVAASKPGRWFASGDMHGFVVHRACAGRSSSPRFQRGGLDPRTRTASRYEGTDASTGTKWNAWTNRCHRSRFWNCRSSTLA